MALQCSVCKKPIGVWDKFTSDMKGDFCHIRCLKKQKGYYKRLRGEELTAGFDY